jgi:hypothetical protein
MKKGKGKGERGGERDREGRKGEYCVSLSTTLRGTISSNLSMKNLNQGLFVTRVTFIVL